MRVSGAALGQVTDAIGIRPEATRVALHRLRKDGWVESLREGRSSSHFLTGYGRAQCQAANPRIYGPGLPPDMNLHLLLADDGNPDARRALVQRCAAGDYIQIGAAAILGPGAPPDDTPALLAFETRADAAPDWLRQRVCGPEGIAESAELLLALERVEAALGRAPELSPLEIAALRVLIVHSWRRLVFRHPNLPSGLFPPGWRGDDCRQAVQALLSRLPRRDAAPALALAG